MFCGHCGKKIDVMGFRPGSLVSCPYCRKVNTVIGEAPASSSRGFAMVAPIPVRTASPSGKATSATAFAASASAAAATAAATLKKGADKGRDVVVAMSKKKIGGKVPVLLVAIAAVLILAILVSGGSSIEGSWATFDMQGNGRVTYTFNSDGTFTYAEFGTVKESGTYETHGGKLTVHANGESATADYKISGNALTISSGGREIVLDKV